MRTPIQRVAAGFLVAASLAVGASAATRTQADITSALKAAKNRVTSVMLKVVARPKHRVAVPAAPAPQSIRVNKGILLQHDCYHLPGTHCLPCSEQEGQGLQRCYRGDALEDGCCILQIPSMPGSPPLWPVAPSVLPAAPPLPGQPVIPSDRKPAAPQREDPAPQPEAPAPRPVEPARPLPPRPPVPQPPPQPFQIMNPIAVPSRPKGGIAGGVGGGASLEELGELSGWQRAGR